MKLSRLRKKRLRAASPCVAAIFAASVLQAQAAPNFNGSTARAPHFRPENGSFVTQNGPEWFNRPLYGGPTAFRADAGDKPEVSLYMPGRGGVLRLGIVAPQGQKWLFEAQNVTSSYIPGAMRYQIRDPLLGSSMLQLDVVALAATEGVMVRAQSNAPGLQLIWAYGGASGERHSRNGDIGTDKIPMSQYFQLQPEHCRNSQFTLSSSGFALQTPRAGIVGTASSGASFSLGDATKWDNLGDLIAASSQTATPTPVVVGRATLTINQPFFIGLERVGDGTEATAPAKPASFNAGDLAGVFEAAETHRREVATRVVARTPDPYIDAAVGALNVAADGVWDESEGAFMHGAVAWRTKLLGWRGSYAGSELGWPDRTRRHLENWFGKQNIAPIASNTAQPQVVPPDLSANYARNEPALHSNGDLSNSHYDMNLPAIDILFRYLEWTGDLEYARQVWPVIERHLAWERRLFRRPFGPEHLPLYEAYAAIWASDDLEYEGGGVTHASAYNFNHNLMAARLAHLLGRDAAPYEREAELIARGMRQQLWLGDQGWFAEWKDLLGLQQTHPSAGLWTFYHTVDSGVTTPFEAWQMARFVDTQTPHFPLQAPGIESGNFTLATTNWMPYTWSTNNVVMAEATHASLAMWQANRDETAFRLFKGALLDSMFLGLCPGNVGMTTGFDLARGESQRDFADGVGATSRALVGGLFGVVPDALSGEIRVRPGFPAAWNHASLKHPQFDFAFRRAAERGTERETYDFSPKWTRPMRLRLQIVARRDQIAGLTLNGRAAKWKTLADSVGTPRIEIQCPPAARSEVVIRWKGNAPAHTTAPAIVAQNAPLEAKFGLARAEAVFDPQHALGNAQISAKMLRASALGALGHRSAFVRVRQGALHWWLPVEFEVRAPFQILPSEAQTPGALRFRVANNTSRAIDREVTLRVGQKTLQTHLQAPALGVSSEITLAEPELVPGTNAVEIELGGGQKVSGEVTNWKIAAPSRVKWEMVDLSPIFNARVTQIFQNEYLSPRSPYVSLAIPKQGIGSWTKPTASFKIDDTGLRAKAAQNGDVLRLPHPIFLRTPGAPDALNIAFTSQWDNYPRALEIPLGARASHLYLLMAGSTNSMQSRFVNGQVTVSYTDGSTQTLPLENPSNWWPIDQDYQIDDFAFARPQAIPPRVDLASGQVRVLDIATFKGKGGKIAGGAATVLDLPLQPGKTLKSLRVETLANEVVIGLMSATLVRP